MLGNRRGGCAILFPNDALGHPVPPLTTRTSTCTSLIHQWGHPPETWGQPPEMWGQLVPLLLCDTGHVLFLMGPQIALVCNEEAVLNV